MPETLIGPLVGLWDVEQGILTTLRTWLDMYLAEVERQHGIRPKTLERPPAPENYHGATKEALSWTDAGLPEVIVTVEPADEPEVSASVGYVQAFEVAVHCVVEGKDGVEQLFPEDSARMQASLYGAAVEGIVQQGELEIPGLEWARMVGSPSVECPDEEKRRQQVSTTTFHVWVAPTVDQNAGPVGGAPQEAPGYTGPEEPFELAPEVETVNVDINAEEIS